MRRDYFELDVSNVDWVADGGKPKQPTVVIEFTGDTDALRDRLTDTTGAVLEATETDAAFRLTDAADDTDAAGVVSVTNRVTGDFILELNVAADDVTQFVRAARRYGESDAARDADGRYRVEIRVDGTELVVHEKATFLVYSSDGDLLRGRSLIPSGVEL
ncbi:DUF5793 family protein [Halobacterium salinarum]|uniref:DUF5793 family protein n=1 Tax=Halobacterium salinarum TaxID=2242 RepID=UPI001F320B89|nr:DUF5793 family protein [Halobacterium salinarum]MCF2238524.1 hypothetical protein [Halobacterium salinarum]MDL0120897.1 DUF5793 family protein [Halobacterium salinarum]